MSLKIEHVFTTNTFILEKPDLDAFFRRTPDEQGEVAELPPFLNNRPEKILPYNEEVSIVLHKVNGKFQLDEIINFAINDNGILPNTEGLAIAMRKIESAFKARLDRYKRRKLNQILGVDFPEMLRSPAESYLVKSSLVPVSWYGPKENHYAFGYYNFYQLKETGAKMIMEADDVFFIYFKKEEDSD